MNDWGPNGDVTRMQCRASLLAPLIKLKDMTDTAMYNNGEGIALKHLRDSRKFLLELETQSLMIRKRFQRNHF